MSASFNSLDGEHYLLFIYSVSGYERISSYWNFNGKLCDINGLLNKIDDLPVNEQIMARFFLSIWTGINYDFDLMANISHLLPDDIGIVTDWCERPYLFNIR